MNEQQILALIALGMDLAERIAKLVAELRAQKGITDEQLREYVATKDAETRAKVEAFLARVETQG
ncbi:MAG TPA: hypothetical protein VN538_01345 [Clostridia bacterium]|nr:hypothetical protein [Clostridia bacterium]